MKLVMLEVIYENSGGCKESELYCGVAEAFGTVPEAEFNRTLNDLQKEGKIGILEYEWKMDKDLPRLKRFIYTPSQ